MEVVFNRLHIGVIKTYLNIFYEFGGISSSLIVLNFQRITIIYVYILYCHYFIDAMIFAWVFRVGLLVRLNPVLKPAVFETTKNYWTKLLKTLKKEDH